MVAIRDRSSCTFDRTITGSLNTHTLGLGKHKVKINREDLLVEDLSHQRAQNNSCTDKNTDRNFKYYNCITIMTDKTEPKSNLIKLNPVIILLLRCSLISVSVRLLNDE